jgi:hypothetical protein
MVELYYSSRLFALKLENNSSIVRLRFESNHIEGDIAEDFGVYPNLQYIDLSDNKFHGHFNKLGEVPQSIHLQNIQK